MTGHAIEFKMDESGAVTGAVIILPMGTFTARRK